MPSTRSRTRTSNRRRRSATPAAAKAAALRDRYAHHLAQYFAKGGLRRGEIDRARHEVFLRLLEGRSIRSLDRAVADVAKEVLADLLQSRTTTAATAGGRSPSRAPRWAWRRTQNSMHTVLLLRFRDGLSHDEMAARLKVSVTTVIRRLYREIRHVRDALARR